MLILLSRALQWSIWIYHSLLNLFFKTTMRDFSQSLKTLAKKKQITLKSLMASLTKHWKRWQKMQRKRNWTESIVSWQKWRQRASLSRKRIGLRTKSPYCPLLIAIYRPRSCWWRLKKKLARLTSQKRCLTTWFKVNKYSAMTVSCLQIWAIFEYLKRQIT